MPQIDCFVSTLSPWAYLAGTRADAIAARHGAELRYRPLDVMALFARTGGLPLAERPKARQEYRLQELRRQAARQGLPLNLSPAHWPTNAAPSSHAIITAQDAGGGDTGALVHALLRACWAEERDIADEAVIRDCLADAGFDPGLAGKGLAAAADAYAANLEEAVERGAFGVPFYITDAGERFWGQDRLEDLDAHLAGRI